MSWWFIWTSTPGKGKQKQKGKRKMTCAFLKKLGCWLTPFKPLCSVHVPALGKLSSFFFFLFLGSPFKSARWHLFDIWEVFFLLLFNLYNLFASATLLPTRGHRPAWHHKPAYKTREHLLHFNLQRYNQLQGLGKPHLINMMTRKARAASWATRVTLLVNKSKCFNM